MIGLTLPAEQAREFRMAVLIQVSRLGETIHEDADWLELDAPNPGKMQGRRRPAKDALDRLVRLRDLIEEVGWEDRQPERSIHLTDRAGGGIVREVLAEETDRIAEYEGDDEAVPMPDSYVQWARSAAARFGVEGARCTPTA